jgi:hypothetical protein
MLSRDVVRTRGGTVAGQDGHGATVGAWVISAVIVLAFVLGGVALIIHTWWLFWVSVAIFVIGVIAGRAIHIMDEVSEYALPGKADPENC